MFIKIHFKYNKKAIEHYIIKREITNNYLILTHNPVKDTIIPLNNILYVEEEIEPGEDI